MIENISKKDCATGNHYDPGPNSMLIQICDPASFPPTPAHQFHEVYQFEFLDLETTDGELGEAAVTQEQADQLVNLLHRALELEMNVVVHCVAGLCRSGAVVEVASMLGFETTERRRQPNILVKNLMMRSLGWTYCQVTL